MARSSNLYMYVHAIHLLNPFSGDFLHCMNLNGFYYIRH